ncbi:MAG TPA: OmpA family protein [Gemmatimonadaceae bacterium]|nr:OmpA family protein [Gemmatimonadaceae bacterium]
MSARLLVLVSALTIAACATTRPSGELAQARTIHQTLVSSGADRRVEADMLRTNTAIAEAEAAFTTRKHQSDVDALGHIALRLAQTAEANNARLLAERAADSLRTARLQRLLTLSEAQRAELETKQQLSEQEMQALRERNLLAEQRADSLRRAAEEANRRLNEAVTQLRSLVAEITNLQQTQRGLVISLSDILFDVGKSTLKPGSQASIQRIAVVLTQYPQHQILVEGHTDATGSDEFNLQLSRDRANSVRTALVAGGVEASRITAEGFGESRPVAGNDTAAGRQQNRRVEIVIVGAGTVADAVPRDTTAAPPP